ncbi:hypothetical protein OG883_14990 [Streptomyces sp. NBC_01142]|uniref:hypothetical protein n=1 Tax=Streptomyces sp. NBC_01142 TaxID=2975865 RepID=UPI00225525FC|nr:hypothetical protein [Streptomyces sp. NBC_01142]MCX4821194.1 hypothetical protein [Streptomyces sp. NBC_01142]
MDLESVTDELYELRPQDFTAARNERATAARKAGDSELAAQIKELRRPTLSAWASNLLVRRRPEKVQPLISLGEGLRRAHQELDGEQLRDLSSRQHALVGALAREARQLAEAAGQPVSDEAQHEVESTLHAVLADPRAAREWAAGHLAKPLGAPVGFTEALQATVLHRPSPGPSAPARRGTRSGRAGADEADASAGRRAEEPRRKQEQLRKLDRARKDAEAAEEKARALEEEREQTEAEHEQAEELLREAEERASTLARELKQAQEQRQAARSRAREAHDRARAADRAAKTARRTAQAAAEQAERPSAESPPG